MKKYLLSILFFIPFLAGAQSYLGYRKLALDAYKAKKYPEAANLWLKAGEATEFSSVKSIAWYNAAGSLALAGDSAQAFAYLGKSLAIGYNFRSSIAGDDDFAALHQTAHWKQILSTMPPVVRSADPYKARFVTTDIDHFWDAYDRAQKDTANLNSIYKQYYLDRASPGMNDYFAIRMFSTKNFMALHDHLPKFYAAIRKNTLAVNDQKTKMQASFVKLKQIYPQAYFPDVYFIIGNFSSAGTVSDNGLLIGLDQLSKSPDIPLDELNTWQRNTIASAAAIPQLIAHELVHYQQDNMASDTTLLAGAVREGMADFIGMLISGSSANERLHIFAKGREKEIWTAFQKEMYLNRGSNWMGNADQETPDHPADLGYWVGYQICKGYYDRSASKTQAVYDMLHIQNYRKFYEQSGVQPNKF